MEYYVGQIFEEMYPSEAAEWCNAQERICIDEIEPITKEVEEQYEEFNSETQKTEIKTCTVEKTIRRFQIQEVPEHIPTKEEQSENRARAYEAEVDPITAHIQRLRDAEQTEEVVTEIAELIAERDAKVKEIKELYPYPTDPII